MDSVQSTFPAHLDALPCGTDQIDPPFRDQANHDALINSIKSYTANSTEIQSANLREALESKLSVTFEWISETQS